MRSVRCSKKLSKDQFDYFVREKRFTDELVTIVIDEGWDTVDIENFVLLYNHANGKHIPLPKFHRKKDTYVNKAKKKKIDAKQKGTEVKEKEKGKKKSDKVDGSGKEKQGNSGKS